MDLVSNEIEHHFLGELFRDNLQVEKVGFVREDDLAEPYNAAIYQTIRNMTRSGQMATAATVGATLGADEKLQAYITAIARLGMGFPGQVEEYAKHLKDLSNRRRIQGIAEQLTGLATNFDGTADELIAKAIGDFQRLAGEGLRRGRTKREVALAVVEDVKRDVVAYSTGLPNLDAAMGGGMYAGKCYGFAARKKVGKTILAGTISHNLNRRGVKHLFICGEMSDQEVEQRNIARDLNINSVAFLKRNDSSLPRRVAEYAVKVTDSTIYEHAPGMSLDDVRRMVASAVSKHQITGFVLDYWQLVGGKAAKETEEYHLRTVAQWIADVCRKEGLWSIVMAQLNQEGNSRGGEGLKLACDQYYVIHREKDDKDTWLEMEESRYTMYQSVGSEHDAGLYLSPYGPYFAHPDDPRARIA